MRTVSAEVDSEKFKALDTAMKLAEINNRPHSQPPNAESVIADAKLIEAYLNGADESAK